MGRKLWIYIAFVSETTFKVNKGQFWGFSLHTLEKHKDSAKNVKASSLSLERLLSDG